MHEYEWKSDLSNLMKSFIEMNHLAELKFEQQERFLRHFDHFCFYNGYGGQILTRETAESFIYGQGGRLPGLSHYNSSLLLIKNVAALLIFLQYPIPISLLVYFINTPYVSE